MSVIQEEAYAGVDAPAYRIDQLGDAGIATVAGTGQVSKRLAGDVPGTGTASATLSNAIPGLSGTADGVSSVSGTLTNQAVVVPPKSGGGGGYRYTRPAPAKPIINKPPDNSLELQLQREDEEVAIICCLIV